MTESTAGSEETAGSESTAGSVETASSGEIYFVGASSTGPAGLTAGEDINYGFVADFFGRAKQEVEAEWQAMIDNTQQLLTRFAALEGAFTLQTVDVELGFSAEGRLGFIAKAGATASVKLGFCRKP
jgi:hypothetical protein